jgi:hypothetical protein
MNEHERETPPPKEPSESPAERDTGPEADERAAQPTAPASSPAGAAEGEDEDELFSGALARSMSRPPEAELVLSLARVARSFITYDARNVAVRRLLAAFRDVVRRATQKGEELVYVIGPFEILWGEEVVYRELDRERSMAFRLFRDGVRGFTIKPKVGWTDLLKLIEVLSVRYRGIRQQEDDTLTLLRQADFDEIDFDVVDVYVPSEEDPEEAAEQQRFIDKAMPPADWDQPLPNLARPVPIALEPLTEDQIAALRDEYGEGALVRGAVQVANEMLQLAKSSADSEIQSNVLLLCEEICKYLVVELRPSELVKVVRQAQALLPDHEETKKIAEAFGSGDILDRFLRDPDDMTADALMPLFALIREDHLDRVVNRFVEEPLQQTRRALMKILSRLAMGKPEALLNRLGDVPTDRMVDLFNVICVVAPPERALEAAYSMTEHESPDVQLGALEVLAIDSYNERFHNTLNRLLNTETPRLRVRAAAIFGQKCGRRGFPLLREHTEQLARNNKLDEIEAMTLGKALMTAARELAIPLLREWVKPRGIKGIFKKVSQGGEATKMLRFAAVTGLESDKAEQTRKLLEWLLGKSDGELHKRCEQALAKMPSAEELKAEEQQRKQAAEKAAPAPKPAAKQAKPAAKQAKPAAKQAKPAAKQAKPAAKSAALEPGPSKATAAPAKPDAKPAAKPAAEAAKPRRPGVRRGSARKD